MQSAGQYHRVKARGKKMISCYCYIICTDWGFLAYNSVCTLFSPSQSRQRYFMCHLEGGPWLEITLRTLTLITVLGIEHNPASPFGAAIKKKKKITCAYTPEYIPWKQYLALGLIRVVPWFHCIYFSYLAARKLAADFQGRLPVRRREPK